MRKHAKHTLVPHKANKYHPHLIRWYGIAIVVVLAVVAQLGYNLATTGQLAILGRESNITMDGLLDNTNQAREQAGLESLRFNEQLNRAAQLKAQDMFDNNYWAHESPEGVTPWKWLGDVGYMYNVAGENLAKNFADSDSTVNAWLASDTHRANILEERYNEVGFAVVEDVLDGRETVLVVAYYGSPSDAVVGVAGTTDENAETAVGNVGQSGSPWGYFASAAQSLSLATLGAIAMLTLVAGVAAVAHTQRNKLPKKWRQSWRLHHGAYKFGGTTLAIILMIVATGGGQI